MKIFYFIFLLLLNVSIGVSQNITIKGKAHPSHIGEEIILTDFSDYITYTKIKESSDTIGKDGYFELKLQSGTTKPVLIKINNLVGKIYVQPNFVYGVYFPPKDSLNNNQEGTETLVNISVYGHDSTELNALIIDFNTQYNNLFLKSTNTYLSPAKVNSMLDSFLLFSKQRYKEIKNPYFKQYVEYSFAGFFSNTSRSKSMLFKQFIAHKPILYNNYEYMEFFNTYFKGYFKDFASKKNGGSIFNSINSFGNYQELFAQLKGDKYIDNDTLRELVILKNLTECYYSPDFDKLQVQSIIEQFYRETAISEHKKISLQILQIIYQLNAGADAPDFLASNKTGNLVSLSTYKGKYIYLNFFSTQSDISQKEMLKIVDLKKKFNDKITFISVCLDDSIQSYKSYLKSNPKQDWVILYQSKNSTAKQAYNVKGLSSFFFINQNMQLALSPALMPSEGIEYKFNAMFRPKKKNTITGIR